MMASMFQFFRKIFKRQRDFDKIVQPILPKLRAAKVRKLGFFGSFARGEERPGSDVDVLVDFAPEDTTLDNLWEAHEALQALFRKRKVDFVTLEGLSPYIGPEILKTVKYVHL
jgi:predicted nucleotidyltransferase